MHPEIPGKAGKAPEAPVIKLLAGKRLGGIDAVAVVRAGEIALEPLRAELHAAHAVIVREQEVKIVVFKFDGVLLAAGEVQIERVARKRLHAAGGVPFVRLEIGEPHLGDAAGARVTVADLQRKGCAGDKIALPLRETTAGVFLIINKIVLCRPAGTGKLSLFVQQLRRYAVFFHVRPP